MTTQPPETQFDLDQHLTAMAQLRERHKTQLDNCAAGQSDLEEVFSVLANYLNIAVAMAFTHNQSVADARTAHQLLYQLDPFLPAGLVPAEDIPISTVDPVTRINDLLTTAVSKHFDGTTRGELINGK